MTATHAMPESATRKNAANAFAAKDKVSSIPAPYLTSSSTMAHGMSHSMEKMPRYQDNGNRLVDLFTLIRPLGKARHRAHREREAHATRSDV
jgi:hypothetical protein